MVARAMMLALCAMLVGGPVGADRTPPVVSPGPALPEVGPPSELTRLAPASARRLMPAERLRPHAPARIAVPQLGGVSPWPERRIAARPAQAVPCIVTQAGDAGPGSLRACLEAQVPGMSISFDRSVFPVETPVTIAVQSSLPWIDVDGLMVDGRGAGVVLDGSALAELGPEPPPFSGGWDGLVIDGARGVQIAGLHIERFPWSGIALLEGTSHAVIGRQPDGRDASDAGNTLRALGDAGVWVEGATTGDVVIAGNRIDMAPAEGREPGQFGIAIIYAGGPLVVGGSTPGDGNTILGSRFNGISIEKGAQNMVIQGNHVGVTPEGVFGSNEYGIVLQSGARNVTVGGLDPGQRNLIAGNRLVGVALVGANTESITVSGNWVGLMPDGSEAPAKHYQGISLARGAHDNMIGGFEEGSGNVVGGSTEGGIVLDGAGVTANQVLGNRVGTDPTGRDARPNTMGIAIARGASGNDIGAPGAGNLVSGNGRGINLSHVGTTDNRVDANRIGVDATGLAALPNAAAGILVFAGASGNVLGGVAGNLVAGNQGPGVLVQDEESTDNRIVGNRIGTDDTGTVAIPNEAGVTVRASARTAIGGLEPGEGNLISGNVVGGIVILDAMAQAVSILGNRIGTDASGTAAVPNGTYGILAIQAGRGHVIGDGTPGGRNVISGNTLSGIALADVVDVAILGNTIGTDVTGRVELGNGTAGIEVGPSTVGLRIGSAEVGGGNDIAANRGEGIAINGPDTMGIVVAGNRIGAIADGAAGLGNRGSGIVLSIGVTDSRIGGSASEGNAIAGNEEHGILIQHAETTGIRIQGNRIGTHPAHGGRGNAGHGVLLAASTSGNWVGEDAEGAANRIVGNEGAGIAVDGTDLPINRFAGNVIYGNDGQPIDYLEFDPSPVPAPRWSDESGCAIAGRACPGCIVEVFDTGGAERAAQRLLGRLTADAEGAFLIPSSVLAGVRAIVASASAAAEGPTSELGVVLGVRCSPIILPAAHRP